MNEFQIHSAIGEISEELIDPVAKLRQKKRYPVLKWAAAAACLCLLLSWDALFVLKSESVNDGLNLEAPQENYFSDAADSATVVGSTFAAVFRAKVLEVYGASGILVEPLEGEDECGSSDRFEVSFGSLKQIPDIKAGDIVEITYDGMIQEIYPCRLPGVISIEVIE